MTAICPTLLRLASEDIAIAAFVGALWSFLVEAIPAFQALSFAAKRWVVLGLCLGTPLLALGLSAWMCAIAIDAAAVVCSIAAGCLAFTVSQVAHLRTR